MFKRTTLATAAAVLALIGGGGVAVAATHGSSTSAARAPPVRITARPRAPARPLVAGHTTTARFISEHGGVRSPERAPLPAVLRCPQAVSATRTSARAQPAPGPSASDPAPPRRAMLRALAFVVGSASLGAEIAAARVCSHPTSAPRRSSGRTRSRPCWWRWRPATRSAGGWRTGAPTCAVCVSIVFAAAVLLALVPFVADPFLSLSVKALGALSVGGFLGSLAAVLVLVAVPVLLLGTVAPYANRLALGARRARPAR